MWAIVFFLILNILFKILNYFFIFYKKHELEKAYRAAQKKGPIDVYVSTFKPMKHTLSGRDEKGLMKLIVEQKTGRVIGLHLVGPDTPEIAQGFAVAMKAGATKAHFDSTVGIHPTAAEELVTMREKTR